jgi:hypothetical protein
MIQNRYRYFRWTKRTSLITFVYVALVPGIVGYLGYKNDVSAAVPLLGDAARVGSWVSSVVLTWLRAIGPVGLPREAERRYPLRALRRCVTMMGLERRELYICHMLRRTPMQGMEEAPPQIIPMLRGLVGDCVIRCIACGSIAERLLYLKAIRVFIAAGPIAGPQKASWLSCEHASKATAGQCG